ncbi:hypothetical protein POVWA1_066190 [Plasmodium ovale wallikeri]|uniref:Uncharacterized protein n=1 Tax=Plasmodium ovale wallikeri TaxID=864142 RepID=A0A1A9ADT2_PLAOA|nr:hypothetical protein POVWA1_066190 [Plasmodium ovale wallikeri]
MDMAPFFPPRDGSKLLSRRLKRKTTSLQNSNGLDHFRVIPCGYLIDIENDVCNPPMLFAVHISIPIEDDTKLGVNFYEDYIHKETT